MKRKCPVGTKVQTLLFKTEKFDVAAAKAWAKENDFKYGDVDEKDNYIHLRQIEPDEFDKGSFRTIGFTDDIKAVIGCPKEKLASGASVRHSPSRKGPTDSATWHEEGFRMIGNDGNLWEVRLASNGVKRWVRLMEGGGGVDDGELVLSFKKVDYHVDIDRANMEVCVTIDKADSVDQEVLSNINIRWEQHRWGYMIYPKGINDLYQVLSALKVRVSKSRLVNYFETGIYAEGGQIGEIISLSDMKEMLHGREPEMIEKLWNGSRWVRWEKRFLRPEWKLVSFI